jgi:hypothetical protein
MIVMFNELKKELHENKQEHLNEYKENTDKKHEKT